MTELKIYEQICWLFLLAMPVACIAWTVTHEEIFREIHEYCVGRSKSSRMILSRKFFYLLTCEYCFSHYVTILMLLLSNFTLLLNGWRGYVLAGFSIVWIANVYMGLYALLKVDVKKERTMLEIETAKQLTNPSDAETKDTSKR